jgi:predicted enzyme related to lactoylglutathione lyase
MKDFYKKAFGWKFSNGVHKGVHSIESGSKKGLTGSFLERGEFIPDYLSLYIEVENIEKALAQIEKSGGQVIRPPFRPDGKMELAIVSDPEGHVITLKKGRKDKKRGKS